mmetsp:Transcript_19501/g.32077  ORF Transcript_19501/g.32077 Transcript_19501/m.32077 type:complete len:387 (+) Transcript_19501:58-1218(+)
MFSTSAATYGLGKHHCRSIGAVCGVPDRHLFIAGTTCVNEGNEVHVVEFDENANAFQQVARFDHKGEVWDLAPHPSDASLLLTCSRNGGKSSGQLFRMDIEHVQPGESRELESLGALPIKTLGDSLLRRMVWHPAGDDDALPGAQARCTSERFVSVQDDTVRLWELAEGRLDDLGECTARNTEEWMEMSTMCACWDPHHENEFAIGRGTKIETIDLRSMEVVRRIDNAHNDMVHDIDYNPNKPYYLASGGDDRMAKFWDIRKVDTPVKVITAGNHWVCNVKYNRFHDQLVLTTGTDSMVSLWRLSSISSAPLLELEEDEESGNEDTNGGTSNETCDSLVKSYGEHADSVYGAAWSACDAWVFASLSYDGKIVVNHVASAEKYKILL